MASLSLTTAALNFNSLVEEKLFQHLFRGANAPCRAPLQTLAFLAHLAIAVYSASGVAPQGM